MQAAEIVRAAVTGAEIVVAAADVLVAGDGGAGAVDGREAAVDDMAAVAVEGGTKLLLPRIFTDSTDKQQEIKATTRVVAFFVLTAGEP